MATKWHLEVPVPVPADRQTKWCIRLTLVISSHAMGGWIPSLVTHSYVFFPDYTVSFWFRRLFF